MRIIAGAAHHILNIGELVDIAIRLRRLSRSKVNSHTGRRQKTIVNSVDTGGAINRNRVVWRKDRVIASATIRITRSHD